MQLAHVGRNEPCPCGSGRKYKKCCLEQASTDPRSAALVDRAIESDDWEPVHEAIEPAFELFEPLAPLEHVRFRDDLITANRPDRSELSRLCSGGWLRGCEREIGHVLDRHELEDGEREGLQLALHLVRRFGALSPVVEFVAELQADERAIRARKLADMLSRLGLSMEGVVARLGDMLDWIADYRPSVLPFADWFALWTTVGDQAVELWLSGIARRVCDVCLEMLDRENCSNTSGLAELAVFAFLGRVPRLGVVLGQDTDPLMTTDDERMLHAAITTGAEDARLDGILPRIEEAMDARGDFAGAALLRDARQRLAAPRTR